MRILTWAAAGLMLAAATAASAQAQRLTEQYIPIGESPGVSGSELAVIGTVTEVDQRRGVMTVDVAGQPTMFVMTPQTHVWLDRSDEGGANLDVGYAGLNVGDVVEVKSGEPAVLAASAGGAKTPVVEWIKIDATER
jgi:hypothetical protein